MLKFKFFESDNLRYLESELNKFVTEHEDEVNNQSIVKIYYNRTPISVSYHLTNSVILVWDYTSKEDFRLVSNPIDKQKLFFDSSKKPIDSVEVYENTVDDDKLKQQEQEQEQEQEQQEQEERLQQQQQQQQQQQRITNGEILTEVDRIINKWHVTDEEEIFNHVKTLIKPSLYEINKQWLKYIIHNIHRQK